MTDVEFSEALKILFEKFWIVRKNDPEKYAFLRRHQAYLQKEIRERFGMSLIIKNTYIQLLKRPLTLEVWMGDIGFTSQLDYALLCLSLAYIEGEEVDKAFMLDELIREIELVKPEKIIIDWTNYNHRKSLVRVIKQMLEFGVIETIQGEADEFEQSEYNQEILFITTSLARAFLSRAPQSYTEYENFNDYWNDWKVSRNLTGNQEVYQNLLMLPVIQRTPNNEELFVRLRNYYHHMAPYFMERTFFNFELYQDYAALTLEQRDNWQDVFPSRRVVDEILIQLATVLRKMVKECSAYGVVTISMDEWNQIISYLRKNYSQYWSKEFLEMSNEKLQETLFNRGKEWHLFEKQYEVILINPMFSRLIAEMRNEDE